MNQPMAAFAGQNLAFTLRQGEDDWHLESTILYPNQKLINGPPKIKAKSYLDDQVVCCCCYIGNAVSYSRFRRRATCRHCVAAWPSHDFVGGPQPFPIFHRRTPDQGLRLISRRRAKSYSTVHIRSWLFIHVFRTVAAIPQSDNNFLSSYIWYTTMQ